MDKLSIILLVTAIQFDQDNITTINKKAQGIRHLSEKVKAIASISNNF